MMASRPLQLNTPLDLGVTVSSDYDEYIHLKPPQNQSSAKNQPQNMPQVQVTSSGESVASTPTDDYFSIRPKLSVTISNEINSTHYPLYYQNSNQAHPSTHDLSSPPEYSSAEYEYEADEDEEERHAGTPFTPFTPLTPSLDNEADSTADSSTTFVSSQPQSHQHPAAFFSNPMNLSMNMGINVLKKDPSYTAYNFLLVDDNVINLRILEKVLRKLYPLSSVTKIQDSTLVQQAVSRERFDLVFLDIDMPSITGVELARYMRSNQKYDSWGIIAVTTRSTPNDISVYASAGIDYTFSKPLNNSHDHIMDTINTVLQVRKDTQ